MATKENTLLQKSIAHYLSTSPELLQLIQNHYDTPSNSLHSCCSQPRPDNQTSTESVTSIKKKKKDGQNLTKPTCSKVNETRECQTIEIDSE